MHTAEPVSVFLLDGHEIVLRGVADLLDQAPDLRVVGEAGTVAALPRLIEVRPQVALLAARLPDGSGIAVCREIGARLPGTRCLILSNFDSDGLRSSARTAGALGYLRKDVRGSDLRDAVRTVARGGSLWSSSGQRPADAPSVTGMDRRLKTLSERERHVLDLLADGLTNKEIGHQLFLAEKTVKNYVSVVLCKLGVDRRTKAALVGAEARNRAPVTAFQP